MAIFSVHVPETTTEDDEIFRMGSKVIRVAITSPNEGINVAIQNFSPNFSRKYFEKFPELSIVITIALACLFSVPNS